MPLPRVPNPGSTPLTDGFSLRITGDDVVQARLLAMGPLVKARIYRILDVIGRELAVEASRHTPVGKKRRRRMPGRLRGSFGVFARPAWEKLGLIGVAVRSTTNYHYYQEFGVDAPNRQVVLHRDDNKKMVPKSMRYRNGTNRLADGVRVHSFRRDFHNPALAMLGNATRKMKGQLAEDVATALSHLLGGDLNPDPGIK